MNVAKMMQENAIERFAHLDDQAVFSGYELNTEADPILASVQEEKPDKHYIKKASYLMHTGVIGKDLAETLRGIQASEADKKQVNNWNGILGTVLVDCSLFRTAADYKVASQGANFKGMAQFAIHCTCHHTETVRTAQESKLTGNSIEAALDTPVDVVTEIPYCKKLGMPVLGKVADYPMSSAISVMRRLVALDLLATKDAKKLLVVSASPLASVRNAFQLIMARKHQAVANQYKAQVDNSAFKVENADMMATATKLTAVGEVLPKELAVKTTLEAVQKPVGRISVADRDSSQVQVVLSKEKEQVKVDPRNAGLKEIPLNDNIHVNTMSLGQDASELCLDLIPEENSIEVVNELDVDPEWFDSDIVAFDMPEETTTEDLDVNGQSSFDIEM